VHCIVFSRNKIKYLAKNMGNRSLPIVPINQRKDTHFGKGGLMKSYITSCWLAWFRGMIFCAYLASSLCNFHILQCFIFCIEYIYGFSLFKTPFFPVPLIVAEVLLSSLQKSPRNIWIIHRITLKLEQFDLIVM